MEEICRGKGEEQCDWKSSFVLVDAVDAVSWLWRHDKLKLARSGFACENCCRLIVACDKLSPGAGRKLLGVNCFLVRGVPTRMHLSGL
jgi:hypothetical protein